MLHNLLKELFTSNGGTASSPYDWESADDEAVKKFSLVPFEGHSESQKRAQAYAKGYERHGTSFIPRKQSHLYPKLISL
jgi:hypothetical protein